MKEVTLANIIKVFDEVEKIYATYCLKLWLVPNVGVRECCLPKGHEGLCNLDGRKLDPTPNT